MANLNGFNAHEVEPNTVPDPIPAGKYVAAITDSTMKPTKAGDGSYLELTFIILEGEHQNRKLWDRLCLQHPNDLTRKIAEGNLSAICRAVGVMKPNDSADLHNLPMLITVACEKRKDTGAIGNVVKGYEAKDVADGVPQQIAATDQTPPWKR